MVSSAKSNAWRDLESFMRSALTITLVSKTYVPLVFIQYFLQDFRSKAPKSNSAPRVTITRSR